MSSTNGSSSNGSSPTAAGEAFPKLIAFDLDYTLWNLWIDTHITGPLRRQDNRLNEVLDKYGDVIAFYADVAPILHSIRARSLRLGYGEEEDENKVVIAACSRTHAPDLAYKCLELLLVPPSAEHAIFTPTPAIDFFDETEIYPGSKTKHFKTLHQRTGIPYSEMVFFDDEHRNAEVEKLGVTFYHCPRGLSHDVFNQGLKKWRRRHSRKPPQ